MCNSTIGFGSIKSYTNIADYASLIGRILISHEKDAFGFCQVVQNMQMIAVETKKA